MRKSIFSFLMLFFFGEVIIAQIVPPSKFGPVPNERQMKYLHSPLAAFIHFGMNTFAGSDGIEWGNDVKRPASVFNPTNRKVDTDQWVRLLKKAGFTKVIITLKHHDGFCYWPTKVTDYNISKSPYMNGKGDLAKELSESCDKYGMDMGIYLSPWDAWEPSYGDSTPGDYNDFYDTQLRELLGGNYGRLNLKSGKREIAEIWLDGATGEGAAHQTYDFVRFVHTVRELQPGCLTWMTLKAAQNYSGPESEFPVDAFWVGNEKGYVNDPVWMKVAVNGEDIKQYQSNGQYMSLPEADVSIRPGWFYHSAQDKSVKTLDYLIHDIYFRTVGMGIPLLLNVPPDREGKFSHNDSVALMKFGIALKNTFETNLLNSKMNVLASDLRGKGFEPANVLDDDYDSYWTMTDGRTTGTLTIDLGKEVKMDVICLQEYIPLGQRISGWKVEVEVYGNWREFGSGQTIGYKRMIKGALLPVRKIRLSITSSLAVPQINNIQAYRSDSSIATQSPVPKGINSTSLSARLTGKDLLNWTILENDGSSGKTIYSSSNKAAVRFNTQGGWFGIIGTKSPASGIMEVWIDGVKKAKVDTYSTVENKFALLYENNLLSAGNHTILLKVTGKKNSESAGSNIILQNLLHLDKDAKGLFEMAKTFEEFHENSRIFQFNIHRYGNLREPASVTFSTLPGTGVHGKTYADKTQTLQFAAGESLKTATVTILENSLAEGNKDFYIELNSPTNKHVLGFNSVMRVLVKEIIGK
ncbi:MAG: alpha-L-fucosidase [Paludibacteraceae bacterium]